MTRKEIGIIEAVFHEVFEKRQESEYDKEDWNIYQAQMDIIDEIEDRLGIDVSAYWKGEEA